MGPNLFGTSGFKFVPYIVFISVYVVIRPSCSFHRKNSKEDSHTQLSNSLFALHPGAFLALLLYSEDVICRSVWQGVSLTLGGLLFQVDHLWGCTADGLTPPDSGNSHSSRFLTAQRSSGSSSHRRRSHKSQLQ